MKIKLTSVSIDDYDKALKFYTEILGFVEKNDIPTTNLFSHNRV
jgi:catechol 2,3-dioxygenase-like lactoylglutathione lyase family enzyme